MQFRVQTSLVHSAQYRQTRTELVQQQCLLPAIAGVLHLLLPPRLHPQAFVGAHPPGCCAKATARLLSCLIEGKIPKSKTWGENVFYHVRDFTTFCDEALSPGALK